MRTCWCLGAMKGPGSLTVPPSSGFWSKASPARSRELGTNGEAASGLARRLVRSPGRRAALSRDPLRAQLLQASLERTQAYRGAADAAHHHVLAHQLHDLLVAHVLE